jgi:hypothetical protein
MNLELLQRIEKSSAHTQSRINNATYILENNNLVEELIVFSFDTSNKLHIRACCILEKVFELQLDLAFPFLDSICNDLKKLKNDSAIRSISRFIMLLVQKNTKKQKTNENYLTESQLEKITESCFDWLISDYRVAVKAHAIYTLYELGKTQDWIYPELKVILEQDSAKHSAGYKVCARETLKKINQHNLSIINCQL